jgi:hypothetical protein
MKEIRVTKTINLIMPRESKIHNVNVKLIVFYVSLVFIVFYACILSAFYK